MHSTPTLTESPAPVTQRDAGRPKRWLVTVGKGAISSILLLWLLKDTSVPDITKAVHMSYIPMILLAFSLHFLGCFLSVMRWRVLLLAQHIDIPLPCLFRSYMVAIFFNNLLPSTIGGDVVRVHDTYRIGKNKGGAVAAVFVDRLLGIFVLMSFVLLSLLISGQFKFFSSYMYVCIMISIAAIAIITVFFRIFNKKIFNYFRCFNIKIIKIINNLKEHKKIIFIATLLSIGLQINVVLYYFLISSSIGVEVTIMKFFFIVPVAVFGMMIPISINGIGLRENIFVFMMSIYQVNKNNSIAIAWIDYGMIVMLGIIGGIIYIIRK